MKAQAHALLVLIFMTAPCLFTAHAQVYNQTAQSAEYVRTMNRNAATDAADIVVYNPAGLADLSEGCHLNVANQVWFRRPSHTFDDPLAKKGRMRAEQDGTDWLIPNMHAVYRRSDWAVFVSAYIPGGAASVDYPRGSFSTRAMGAQTIGPGGPLELIYGDIKDEFLEATSLYVAISAGGAMRVTPGVSLAAGVRTISVENEMKAGLTLTQGLFGPLTQDVALRVHAKEKGRGWGIVAGIQAKPSDRLTLAAHYESPVRLQLTTSVLSDDNASKEAGLFTDGAKSPRDLPAMVGLGASYRVLDNVRCELNLNYWFQKEADWGKAADTRDIADMAGDSYSVGAAVAYSMMPGLELSTGFLYTWYAFEDMDGFYNNSLGAIEVFYENDIMAGLGFAYEIRKGLRLNCGVGVIVYKDASVTTPQGAVKMANDSSSAIALGMDWSF